MWKTWRWKIAWFFLVAEAIASPFFTHGNAVDSKSVALHFTLGGPHQRRVLGLIFCCATSIPTGLALDGVRVFQQILWLGLIPRNMLPYILPASLVLTAGVLLRCLVVVLMNICLELTMSGTLCLACSYGIFTNSRHDYVQLVVYSSSLDVQDAICGSAPHLLWHIAWAVPVAGSHYCSPVPKRLAAESTAFRIFWVSILHVCTGVLYTRSVAKRCFMAQFPSHGVLKEMTQITSSGSATRFLQGPQLCGGMMVLENEGTAYEHAISDGLKSSPGLIISCTYRLLYHQFGHLSWSLSFLTLHFRHPLLGKVIFHSTVFPNHTLPKLIFLQHAWTDALLGF